MPPEPLTSHKINIQAEPLVNIRQHKLLTEHPAYTIHQTKRHRHPAEPLNQTRWDTMDAMMHTTSEVILRDH